MEMTKTQNRTKFLLSCHRVGSGGAVPVLSPLQCYNGTNHSTLHHAYNVLYIFILCSRPSGASGP